MVLLIAWAFLTKSLLKVLWYFSDVFQKLSNSPCYCGNLVEVGVQVQLLVTVVSARSSITRPGLALGRTLHSTEQCSETSASQRRDSKTSCTSSSYCKSQTFAISWRTSGEVRVHWAQWGTCLSWRCLAGRRGSTGLRGTAYYSPRMRPKCTPSSKTSNR